MMMKKVAGILGLLVVIVTLTSLVDTKFLGADNIRNTFRWTGEFGILSLGEAFVIITGGIDLSVGSIVGLIGSLLPGTVERVGVLGALLLMMALSLGIGLCHGLLITKLRLPPFVVTLCGLFIYRGMARYATGDATQGFGTGYTGFRYLAKGTPISLGGIDLPMPFILLILLAAAAGIMLNFSIYGRYLFALGRNEQAARYSGINTDRMVILAYVISAGLAGFAGVLFALDLNSVQPSGHGNFYELYAIAGAVLGGCSLRGGEGSVLGVLLGTAVVRVLYNAINIVGIATQLEFAVIGAVIIFGIVADEVVKRYAERRSAAREARGPP